MDRSLAIIQRLQNVYAQQSGLSVMLMNSRGDLLTRPAWTSRFTEQVIEEIFRPAEWLRKIVRPSILDLYPGMKAIIVPVTVTGNDPYYLCAGVIIARDSRELLYRYLDQDSKERSEWKAGLEQLPDTAEETRRQLLEQLKVLSDTIGVMLEGADREADFKRTVSGIGKMSEAVFEENGFASILQTYLDMCPELTFAGFARRSDGECAVSHMLGEPAYQSLIGTSVALGEGFVGLAMATGIEGCWYQVQRDPRTVLFKKIEPPPSMLVCYPILNDQGDALGVLFGGTTKHKPASDSTIIDRSRIAANVIRNYMERGQLQESMHQKIQRMNALMEISKLVMRAQDVKRIAFMLVDMSLNIVQGRFAAVVLFGPDSNPDEIRIISRGLTSEQSERYATTILRDYQKNERHEPNFRHFDQGMLVQECPIYNQSLYGVLSIALEKEDQESQSFISSLAAIGAIAIHQTRQRRDHTAVLVENLHHAIEHWNSEAYAFSQLLNKRVMGFAEFADLPAIDREELEFASMLAPYHPDVLRAVMVQEPGICRTVHDYYYLYRADDGTAEGNFLSYNRNSQILKLASDSLKNPFGTEATVQASGGIDPELAAEFHSYLIRNLVIDKKVSAEGTIPNMASLSKRELEVLDYIVQGWNNKQIASAMFISEHTVKNHISKIFQKTEVKDRAGLLAYFYLQRK